MKNLIFVIFAIILTGCASAGENNPPSVVPTVPTPTIVEETPTPLPSTTPTAEMSTATQLVDNLDHVPEDVKFPGVLVLYDSLLNLETGYETQLARDWYEGN